MNKFAFAVLITVLALFAFGIMKEDGTAGQTQAEIEIENIWFDELNEAEREQACFGYAFYTKQEIMVQLTTEPDPVDPEKAKAFYKLMEREC